VSRDCDNRLFWLPCLWVNDADVGCRVAETNPVGVSQAVKAHRQYEKVKRFGRCESRRRTERVCAFSLSESLLA